MNLAVVAYPRLADDDRQWIEAFRTRHDPQAVRLGAHFTLVFPVKDIRQESLAGEISTVVSDFRRMSFTLRRSAVVHAEPSGGTHLIFLVPDRGAAEIAALHDRLYAGTLRPYLSRDIPFVPHLTVGAAPGRRDAEVLARELDARATPVAGTIDTIDLVDVGSLRVRSVASFALAAATDTMEHRGKR